MPQRLLSFLLAFLTLWSSFATQEQMMVISADPAAAKPVVVATESGQDRHHDGSVADHHLDDQPAQAHGEAAADHDVLLPHDCRVMACSFAMPVPAHQVAHQMPTPYLDGVRRPPRAHTQTS